MTPPPFVVPTIRVRAPMLIVAPVFEHSADAAGGTIVSRRTSAATTTLAIRSFGDVPSARARLGRL